MTFVCAKCGAELVYIDIFTRYCPNGLDGEHKFELPDGVVIPEYIECEKCGQIYPTRRATCYNRELGWARNVGTLPFFRPDLYDIERFLCLKCTPERLIKWDYVKKQLTGRGK